MLGDLGQVKVLDLGLGALMEADSETSFATAAGHSVGSLDYMSPEQSIAGDVDGRSDLFSLGCTMYHLLTGRVPFPGETVVECLTRRAAGNPVPVNDLRPDLPAPLVEVLAKLMANRPEHRFQTAAEAAEALQDVAQLGEGNTQPGWRPTARVAIHSSTAEPHESPVLFAGSESQLASPVATPAPSLRSRFRLAALRAAWPFVRASVVLAIVGFLIFIVGFALGHTSAIMWLRGEK
jgi:serine/threonine-protein kinase